MRRSVALLLASLAILAACSQSPTLNDVRTATGARARFDGTNGIGSGNYTCGTNGQGSGNAVGDTTGTCH